MTEVTASRRVIERARRLAATPQPEAPKKRRTWLPKPVLAKKHYVFLFLVTGTYLLFELAFNARLLDVVGSTMDEEVVDEIEFFGRFISGIALTLVVWPKILKKTVVASYSRVATAFLMAMALLACCGVSYLVQEGILKAITASSSAEARRAAATMVLLTEAVHSKDIVLNGLPAETVDMSSPEAKTFLALLPALALNTDDLEGKTEREVQEVVRRRTDEAIGGVVHYYNTVYLPSEVGVKESYNGYLKIAQAYEEQLDNISVEQHKAYQKYLKGLGRYQPWNVPQRYFPRVRKKVREGGVQVSDRWSPRDKKGFYAQVEKQIMAEIEPRYRFEISKNFGGYLPHTYDFSQFQADETIQSRWQRDLKIDVDSLQLKSDWSLETFEKTFYDPWVNALADREVVKVLAPVSDFEEGGASEDTGLNAIRIAYVPLVAFIFSCLGALVHTFKTLWFGSMAAVGRIWLAAPILLTAMYFSLGTVVIPQMSVANPVTNAVLYTKLEEQTAEKAGPVLPSVMRTLVQLQPLFYPISEAVRTKVLFGIEYKAEEFGF